MSWQEQGLCWGSLSDLFFPDRTELTTKEFNETVEKAQAICARCPVTVECEEAGQEEEHGIWGGVLK